MSDAFPTTFFDGARGNAGEHLGIVVGGSLNGGLEVKLDRQTLVEGLSVGSYVTITGETGRRFFGLVTDIGLGTVDDAIRKNPPDVSNRLIRSIYAGTAVYATMRVNPQLVLEADAAEAKPVKTVPAHFSSVARATPDEVLALFNARGSDGMGKPYTIGTSLDNENIKISLDLQKLVERSTAVFGRSGTGKTFLTLPLLAGVIQARAAACLIFDMHNDYGQTLKGDKNVKLPGLKSLQAIAQRVNVVTLDEESSRLRNSQCEFALRIGFDQVLPEDIEPLRDELALTDVQVNALDMFKRVFEKRWLDEVMADEPSEQMQALIDAGKISDSTVNAIQRKVGKLLGKLKFLVREHSSDHIERILAILQRGDSVVIEFGRYGNDVASYIFVANLLTKRIHERYVHLKEAAEGGGGAEPQKLVIAIEEAHKFLQPGIAGLTIFGTIARELRKYNVTLLIVDQRPSQIDGEVMSQIGTRITCALSDEKDIAAVFTGVNGAQTLRGVLTTLDSKQQALLLGHALPMPVVVRTAAYDNAKIAEFSFADEDPATRAAENRRKLGRSNPDDSLID